MLAWTTICVSAMCSFWRIDCNNPVDPPMAVKIFWLLASHHHESTREAALLPTEEVCLLALLSVARQASGLPYESYDPSFSQRWARQVQQDKGLVEGHNSGTRKNGRHMEKTCYRGDNKLFENSCCWLIYLYIYFKVIRTYKQGKVNGNGNPQVMDTEGPPKFLHRPNILLAMTLI